MSMAGIKRKLEGEIELRGSAADIFHKLYQDTPHEISNIHPEFVQGCDLHEGEFGTPGSIICWKYTLEGKPQIAKEVIEMVDEKNKMIRFRVIEGDILEYYNTFIITSQVIAEGEEICLVKWIFEYEKKHLGIPEPSSALDALLAVAKQIDDHYHHQGRQ